MHIINLFKRIVKPLLAVSLAIALLALYQNEMTPTTPEQNQSKKIPDSGKSTLPEVLEEKSVTSQTRISETAVERMSDVTIVILNTSKEPPLAFKLGGQIIKVPEPSSWPSKSDSATAGSDKGQYLATIIDTSDVLRTNGHRVGDAFSLLVGGIELNASNTLRIKGNPQPTDDSNGPVEEYHTQEREQGIWHSLRFKNLVLSHAQIPSLEDHLILSQTGTTTTNRADTPDAPIIAQANLIAHRTNSENAGQVTPLEEVTPETTRKYVEAMNSPDPKVRADAVQSLIVNGYREADPYVDSDVEMETIISKSLLDEDPTVRATTLDELDSYDGKIPMATLSHMTLNDGNPALRIQAMDLLVDRFGQQAAPTLKEALHDTDPRVGRVANQYLIEITALSKQ